MKFSRIVLAILAYYCFFAWPHAAHAQASTAVLTCTAPTANTDGTVLAANQKPLVFKFYEGTVNGTYPNASPNRTTCDYNFAQLAPGTHFFVAEVTDAKGVTSARTASVTKVVPNATPNAPSMLAVGADPTAFVVFTVKDEIVAVEVGKAIGNPNCGDMSMNAHGPWAGTKQLNIIPRESVTLLPSIHDNGEMAIFGSCAG